MIEFKIPLTKGLFAIVDEEDYEKLSKIKWRSLLSSKNISYAIRTIQQNYKKENILMHRFVLNLSDKTLHIDHINGNGLDNRKSNLRITNRNGNMRNLTRERVNNTSGYRGVSFDKESNKWLSYIYINRKQKKLGRFTNKEDAAIAFDKAAKSLFGDFCGKLNKE